MPPFAFCNGSSVAAYHNYVLPESIILDSPPPTHLVSKCHQSHQTDKPLLDPVDYDADAEWD